LLSTVSTAQGSQKASTTCSCENRIINVVASEPVTAALNGPATAACHCVLLQADLSDQKWQQQTKEAQLKEQPAWPAIDRLDQQLKQVQQQCDKAREFIKSHEERSNYGVLLPQWAALVETINAANIAAVSGA
jgi:peptidoglycan hydrolase CwlO-like protein